MRFRLQDDECLLFVPGKEMHNGNLANLLGECPYKGRTRAQEEVYSLDGRFTEAMQELMADMGKITPRQFFMLKTMSALSQGKLVGLSAIAFLNNLYRASCDNIDLNRGRMEGEEKDVFVETKDAVLLIGYKNAVSMLMGEKGKNVFAVERRLRKALGCGNYSIRILRYK